MNKRNQLIITVAISIVVITFIFLWISGPIPNELASIGKPTIKNVSELTDANFSMNKLPPEVRSEIRHYEWKYKFTLDRWEFDPVNKTEIKLYAHDIQNENATVELQEKQIGNYTIHIIHDTEFEYTRAEIKAYLLALQKKPEYQIAYISMITDSSLDPTAHVAEIAVFSSTPENKKLDQMVINGWKIEVGIVSQLPVSPGSKTPSNPLKSK